MPSNAKTKEQVIQSLVNHNKNVMAGTAAGGLSTSEVTKAYEAGLPMFVDGVLALRTGNKGGLSILPSVDVSFEKSLKHTFGVNIETFLRQHGVFTHTHKFKDVGTRFGVNGLNQLETEALLLSASQMSPSSFDGLNTTQDVSSAFRWIISEIFLAPIRLGLDNATQHQNWVALQQNMSQKEIVMPFIKRGNATPKIIGEGESIPLGTVDYGQKKASVFKVGTGFKITNELIEASSINMLSQFLQEVGVDMSLATDVTALHTLINGEQADASESAPVVGVGTSGSHVYKDLQRVVGRMRRLGMNATRIITNEEDSLDLTLLEEFKGFAGDTKLGNIDSVMGKVLSLGNDIHRVPDDQVMILDPAKAMAKLNYGAMMVERRYNPQTQENETFVSDHVGFAIVKRDARVLIDSTQTIGAAPFPDYMDIDSRIDTMFESMDKKA